MTTTPSSRPTIEALVFDLDGVLTRTASLHARAWKEMFDDYLRRRARSRDEAFEPFSIEHDYPRYVDGIPRRDGLRNFLASRGIELPEEGEGDTVEALGDKKNARYLELLRQEGAEVFTDTEEQIRAWRGEGLRTAVISSSRNCAMILEKTGLTELFEARVDGVESARRDLAGKPAPDVFLEAVRELGVEPEHAAIFEDAELGVAAGRAGGFALVVGVDRVGDEHAQKLYQNGADVVVSDLRRLDLAAAADEAAPRDPRELPFALEDGRLAPRLAARFAGRRPAVFLDYDGTLTPIVSRPHMAVLAEETRAVLEKLAARCPVAVVSGRDRRAVENFVQLDDMIYAGSHGYDIAGPDLRLEYEGGKACLDDLDAAEKKLRQRLGEIAGAEVERKRFSVAVHYRNVAENEAEEVTAVVDRVIAEHPKLKRGEGKMVYELRPDVDWDKGRAVSWLLTALDLDGDEVLPLYLGDDVTDEDAFKALRRRGLGLAVGEMDRPTFAGWRLRDVDEVRIFLDRLAESLAEAPSLEEA